VPPAHLIVADLQLPASVYPSAARQDAVFDRLLARVKALPGVTAAAWASSVPVRDGAFELPIRTRRGSGDSVVMVDCFVVTREYFAALGIPLRAGRGWEGDGDREVILDRAALALLSPGRSALGRSLLVSFRAPGSGARSWRPVIGLAGSVAVRGGAGRHPEVYVQFRGFPVPFSERVLVVRSAAGSALAPSLRALAARLAPEAPLRRVQTLRAVLAGQTSSERFSALAMGWVGAAGLLLALLGVYALAAYRVQSRRNELAVRAALGASPRRLRLLVAGQAVRWSTWGTGVGLLI
jgi:putative ABC transport system permease protein